MTDRPSIDTAAPAEPAEPAAVVRTLLITDVVDSTQMAERLGDVAMARVWAAHDRVARDLLAPWNGREIDKTDGMLLLFEQPTDAVRYAQSYHAALAGLEVPLRARAGLHVAAVILRWNSAEDVARGGKPLEVEGMAKPTTARVMALARGGQTLLTPEARAALGDSLQGLGLQLGSHGHWVLKGVSEPVELFEVGADPTAFRPPPDAEKAYRVVRSGERWLPVREVPNNLPESATTFIGRERELGEVRLLLGRARLVTLLGMGGLGKTRMSLQLAAELKGEFPDGVWFLDLAPLRDDSLVLAEAAQMLGVREEPGRPLLQLVVQHLREQRALVVVDNCEHLLKPAAALIHAVMKAAPKVAFLTSSRSPLRLPGEQAYPVQPLPLPDASASLEVLQRSPAVRLFVERAREQRPDFELDAAEAPAVAELVSRLEGIPLALELAAARLRTMAVADINRRLKNRFKLLTGGASVRDERQQTLRGLVDWSYDLLQPEEQTVLRRLAVFAGGFDLPAAEHICADDDDIESDDVLDLLGSLVEKSLVAMEQRDGEGRFRMLETIREYAGEKLDAEGGRDAVAARHCQHFFGLARQGRDGMQGPKQGHWVDRLDRDQDNLRAAMLTAQGGRGGTDPLVAAKMAVALQNFWIMRGGTSEGRAVVRGLLELEAVRGVPMAQAHVLYVGAALALTQGDLAEALSWLQQCLALRRGSAGAQDVGATLSTLAVTHLSSGDAEPAREAAQEAVALFGSIGYRVGEAITRLQLGQIEAHRGDAAAARNHLQTALAIAREVRHPETEGEAELALGELAIEDSDVDSALRHLQRSLEVCTQAGDRRGEANARWALGRLDQCQGRQAEALPRLTDALRAFNTFEMRASWAGCIEDLAAAALALEQPERACQLLAAAQRVRDDSHQARSPQRARHWQSLRDGLVTILGPAKFEALWGEAALWETARTQGLALELAAPAAAIATS